MHKARKKKRLNQGVRGISQESQSRTIKRAFTAPTYSVFDNRARRTRSNEGREIEESEQGRKTWRGNASRRQTFDSCSISKHTCPGFCLPSCFRFSILHFPPYEIASLRNIGTTVILQLCAFRFFICRCYQMADIYTNTFFTDT